MFYLACLCPTLQLRLSRVQRLCVRSRIVAYYLGLYGKYVSIDYMPAFARLQARLFLYMGFWSRAHLILDQWIPTFF